MSGDVEGEAPRPRPLSAGIWTLFSWLRRTERSSSSESVSSVGSDRTVASFDFLAPFNYKLANTPLVLAQDPLTETYKKRLHETNLRRQRDRDITLRRKYGLFREEGLGYDAFSLPSARRLQKDSDQSQDRARRATSESIQRRSAYVPGKRRAPLPPTSLVSVTLPRNYKRKRPAPKPPVTTVPEENKENVTINKIIQMSSTSGVDKESFMNKITSSIDKTENHSKHDTKEIKLRTDRSFLKQIFDNKKRNSAVDTNRIKLLPSISELDKQAAEIIEANKALRAPGHNDISFIDSEFRKDSAEDTWICTTCLRKYKNVVSCCIYCIIKENSNNKIGKSVSTRASHTYTQTEKNTEKSSQKSQIDDKKKLREMLKEMKDSLPKRPKPNDSITGGTILSVETPTLRIGSTVGEKDEKNSFNDFQNPDTKQGSTNIKNNAKEIFLKPQPSSSKDSHSVTIKEINTNTKTVYKPSSPKLNTSGNSLHNISTHKDVLQGEKESLESSKGHITKVFETNSLNNKVNQAKNISNNDTKVSYEKGSPKLENVNKPLAQNYDSKNTNQINLLKEIEQSSSEDLPANSQKEKPVEPSINIKVSKICIDSHSTKQAEKNRSEGSGIKDKVEQIRLGDIYSPKTININRTSTDIVSNNSNDLNLRTPLKISSLLNPLYCPKNKTKDVKVADCNFASVLPSLVTTNVEREKNEESLRNEPKILPNVVPTTSVHVQSPSSPKRLNESIQKSEAIRIESPKPKNTEQSLEATTPVVQDLKRNRNENVSSEIRSTATPIVKILDHHNRRRNLINQLEQAISKGDEQLAAEAAAKLAKLKLACSVLSFSSQIVAEASPNKMKFLQDNALFEENKPSASSTNDKSEKIENKEIPISRKEIKILSVPPASTSSQTPNDEIPIELWVEDKEAARGPIPMRISRKARIGDLKRHVETTLGLEIRLQRWIVGRTLCNDDSTPLVSLAGPDLKAPFYLCIVESETNKEIAPLTKDVTHIQIKTELIETNKAASGEVYTELMKLEQQALVSNTEEFECGVCIEQCAAGAGAVLRDCIHTFCRECLTDVIRHCQEPVVPCPAMQCPGALQEREIRAILSAEEYERWLARGLAAAESGTRNTFHCRTRDCKGWAFCEPEVQRFPCPVCKHTNCVPCQAVHEGESCEQYQVKVREAVSAAESNYTDEGTQALLKSLIARGEALECPECSAIITKKWGCDWVKCSACKTEICWVTKGRRWGPGGKGDTSAGCQCGVDGKRCHPSCGYCH